MFICKLEENSVLTFIASASRTFNSDREKIFAFGKACCNVADFAEGGRSMMESVWEKLC